MKKLTKSQISVIIATFFLVLFFISGNFSFKMQDIGSYPEDRPKNVYYYNPEENLYKTSNFAIQGDYIYCSSIKGFMILDLQDLSNITIIGILEYPDYMINEVKVKGKYAYITHLTQGLKIIDVGNPRKPREVANVEYDPDETKMFLNGDYIFISNFQSGLGIINISNPVDPVLIENSLLVPSYVYDCYIQENYAYLACGSLKIIDIENLEKITQISHTTFTKYFYNQVVVVGEYAYLGCFYGIISLDISNPKRPQEIKSFYDLANPDDIIEQMILNDDKIYAFSEKGEILVYEIRNSGNLKIIQNIPFKRMIEVEFYDDKMAYVAVDSNLKISKLKLINFNLGLIISSFISFLISLALISSQTKEKIKKFMLSFIKVDDGEKALPNKEYLDKLDKDFEDWECKKKNKTE
ncbi:LVIVD repeat-containing protein [Candidatus Lokiarchaeum ossiferum]|uniref:LVIVD repeat-containing protein n=1 Tax=Candidatus Lokiarchaeum ossiferum TaxID=2951803 RepID=UPI00352C0294